MKIMTLLGTRPEIIKMSRVMMKLDQHFDHVIVHSGQNYDYSLNQIFFDELEVRKPDHFLGVKADSSAALIADIIAKTDHVLALEQPQAVLIYGDTNTGMAVIAAKKRQIPVFHMEAGNRCFDQRVPEELNRKVIDHLSDINLVLSEHARRYLIEEGVAPETIIKTGSHMPEMLAYHETRIAESTVLGKLKIEPKNFLVVSLHRQENVDSPDRLRTLLNLLNQLAETFGYPVIVSTHPRTREKIAQLDNITLHQRVTLSEPFGFFDYIHLQKNAFCTISDSGTITEEAAILGFPAVMLRESHERPEGMDAGVLIMSGLNSEHVIKSVKTATAIHAQQPGEQTDIDDYQNMNVSEQVVKLIMSYTPYINRTVWHR